MNSYYRMTPVKEAYRVTETYRDEEIHIIQKSGECGRIVPDYMQKPYPLISDRVKKLFEKFIEGDIYRPCVLVDEPDTLFWEFSPRQIPVECAGFTPGGDVKEIVDCGLEPFLRVNGYKKTNILISRMAAESLLRRGYNILELAAVETVCPGERGFCDRFR